MQDWQVIVELIRWDFETWEDHVKVTDECDYMLWQLYQDGLSPIALAQFESLLRERLSQAITATAEKDYYADNFRVCIGPVQSKQYEKARRTGCCGEYDELIQTEDFSVWFGFNYDH